MFQHGESDVVVLWVAREINRRLAPLVDVMIGNDEFYEATLRPDLEIFDRIGGGDSFASGLIYGFLSEQGAQRAVEYGMANWPPLVQKTLFSGT